VCVCVYMCVSVCLCVCVSVCLPRLSTSDKEMREQCQQTSLAAVTRGLKLLLYEALSNKKSYASGCNERA
jgi:hypothetical protein